MITDRIEIGGDEAYLRTSSGAVDLSQGSATSGYILGRIPGRRRGTYADIAGLELLFEKNDLSDDIAHSAKSLIRVDIHKEIFPGLFLNPYSHRVHRIAGSEDLRRGVFDGCTVMDVDGQQTLVSTHPGMCSWTSDIYTFSHERPIDAAAWSIAATRKTPATAFSYSLKLEFWADGVPLTQAPVSASLGTTLDPTAPRFNTALGARNVRSFRLAFQAEVKVDGALAETHGHTDRLASFGRPLLRGINLVEPVASAFDFRSLHEIMGRASTYELFAANPGGFQRMQVSLDLAALLGKDEWVEIGVRQNTFRYFEARLLASELERPPEAGRTAED